jgi:predicted DNA-binding transcriptional regulator YafY
VNRPADTAGRLRRLLAILAWLSQVADASIDEVAARFDLSPEALVAELEMAACCGVPPYTPDQLMEIIVTDTSVSVLPGTALARPRRLTPAEGVALAASARALIAVPGSDPEGSLSRALTKLDQALGGERVGVELDTPAMLETVRAAIEERRLLDISYYSASSDRVSERRVDPIRLFATEGHWYVDAWCETAGDTRRFRVDRIGTAELVGPSERTEPEIAGPPTDVAYVPGPDDRRVLLSIDPAVAWQIESIPVAGPPRTVEGRLEVEVFVGGEAWLARLLLALGPDARVLEPEDDRSVAGDAARRILRRYRNAPAAAAADAGA